MTSSGANPWAWLGLLKWSLTYSDGTSESSEMKMSEEDKAFLDAVMKDGIIDENERMQTILKEVTSTMEKWKSTAAGNYNTDEIDNIETLLQELRDIVEQIDYARAFSAMNGLQFLLGCIQEVQSIPQSIRLVSLGIIATMCQHNPPVQKKLLELGSLKILSDLFFSTTSDEDSNGALRAKIVQAISANVRSYDLVENVFVQLEQAKTLIETGLGILSDNLSDTPNTIRLRTVFFLQALLSSDTLQSQYIEQFSSCLVWSIENLLFDDVNEDNYDVMEMVLSMIEQMLEQKKCVDIILSKKEYISTKAAHRIATIQQMDGEAREFFGREYDLWESIQVLSMNHAVLDDNMEPVSDDDDDDEGPSDEDED